MSAEMTFQKALLQLDYGREEEGEKNLGRAVEEAEREGDELTLMRVLCCLGDFLVSEGRLEEAKPHLTRVLAIEFEEEDLSTAEHNRARELLASMEGSDA